MKPLQLYTLAAAEEYRALEMQLGYRGCGSGLSSEAVPGAKC